MISLYVYLLSLLGVYRVAHMITREDGPFDIFAGLRERAGQETWIGRGLHCTNCVSFWLSAVMMEWLFFTGLLASGHNIITWLGLAGGALVLHLYLYGSA